MTRRKRKVTPRQKKASERNWAKGRIKGMISSFEGFRANDVLSFPEQMKIIKCTRILHEILSDWKPVL